MSSYLASAARFTVLTWLLFGMAYPLLEVGINHILFPAAANGSLVRFQGQVVGSRLIEQTFKGPQWFHGRPSAVHTDAQSSGASNLGPTSAKLARHLAARRLRLDERHPGLAGKRLPADMITSSGSGLDPDVTPANAYLQAPWVAQARGIPVATVRHLIAARIAGPWIGIFGNARVNVLALNLALQKMVTKSQYVRMKH